MYLYLFCNIFYKALDYMRRRRSDMTYLSTSDVVDPGPSLSLQCVQGRRNMVLIEVHQHTAHCKNTNTWVNTRTQTHSSLQEHKHTDHYTNTNTNTWVTARTQKHVVTARTQTHGSLQEHKHTGHCKNTNTWVTARTQTHGHYMNTNTQLTARTQNTYCHTAEKYKYCHTAEKTPSYISA